MNQLVLKFFNEERVIYHYFPEGQTNFGEVEYRFDTNEAYVTQQADNDETGRYAHKARAKIKAILNKRRELPRNFMQAWG